MKKILLSFLMLMILSSCSSVPDGFDKNTLETKSQEVIDLMESYQVEEVISLLRTDLQALIAPSELKANLETKYESVGDPVDKITFTISDTIDPQTDELYATVIAQVDHENGRSTYTISFNKDYQLVGLYIK